MASTLKLGMAWVDDSIRYIKEVCDSGNRGRYYVTLPTNDVIEVEVDSIKRFPEGCEPSATELHKKIEELAEINLERKLMGVK